MIPRHIKGATHRLGKPSNWNPDDGECVRLWVRVEGATCSSAWEPTPEELAALQAGGSIVLTVHGGQPPVMLSVEMPEAEG